MSDDTTGAGERATPALDEIAQAARYAECHEEVTRKGELQPCDGIAVAVRFNPEGGFYPVCSRHTRPPVVRLGDLLAAVKSEAWSEGSRHESEFLTTFGQFCPGNCAAKHNPYLQEAGR